MISLHMLVKPSGLGTAYTDLLFFFVNKGAKS